MRHTSVTGMLWGALCGALACAPALAEKADASKPITVSANSGVLSMASRGGNLEGDVVLKRGTLVVKAEKAVLTEDPEGFKSAMFWAAPGGLVTFRQKRDGGDLWTEGQAERIEYDGKLDIMKLFSKARVAQLDGTAVAQQALAPYIAYDSRREEMTMFNSATGEKKAGAGRVEMTIDSARQAAPTQAAGKK